MANPETSPLHFTLGPKGPRKFEWIKDLYGVLHGMQWMMFVIYWILCRGGSNTKPGDYDNLWYSVTYCIEGPS